jgi:DHA2 family multidrug resistance protein
MVVFRLIQGAAGAAMIPSSQAIMMETFPPEEQQMAMALWGMGLMVAPIAGPTLGGWITDNWSWRWKLLHQRADWGYRVCDGVSVRARSAIYP